MEKERICDLTRRSMNKLVSSIAVGSSLTGFKV